MIKRRVVIDNETNQIENEIKADNDFSLPGKTIIAHDKASREWSYDGTKLIEPAEPVRPAPPPFEPTELSILIRALENNAGITQDEKDAAKAELIAER